MSATFNLFERWKAKKGFKSDNQGALALGIPRQTVQNWKEGRNGEPEYIVRMANDLGESPVKTVLEAYAEQKKGDSAKVLMKLSKQFGVMVLAVLGIFSAITPNTAQASADAHFAYSVQNIYYVNNLRYQIPLTGHYRQLNKIYPLCRLRATIGKCILPKLY